MFAFLSLFIYVEFGWKTYVLVDCNPGMRCKWRILSLYFHPSHLGSYSTPFAGSSATLSGAHCSLAHASQDNYYVLCIFSLADYYRVYQVFMSVLKLFLLFLVRATMLVVSCYDATHDVRLISLIV